MIIFQILVHQDTPYQLQRVPDGPSQVMDPSADLYSSTQNSDLDAPDHRASHRRPEAEEGNFNAIYAPVLQERPSFGAETERLRDLGAVIC